jgi:hypothetical protein
MYRTCPHSLSTEVLSVLIWTATGVSYHTPAFPEIEPRAQSPLQYRDVPDLQPIEFQARSSYNGSQ